MDTQIKDKPNQNHIIPEVQLHLLTYWLLNQDGSKTNGDHLFLLNKNICILTKFLTDSHKYRWVTAHSQLTNCPRQMCNDLKDKNLNDNFCQYILICFFEIAISMIRQQNITFANVDPNLWHYMASPGHKELSCCKTEGSVYMYLSGGMKPFHKECWKIHLKCCFLFLQIITVIFFKFLHMSWQGCCREMCKHL